jgi:hypothetical protein
VKPRTPKTNVFEELGRAKKAARLLLAVEELAEHCGFGRPDFAAFAERLNAAQWNALAVTCGQRPPSTTTIGLVVELLGERSKGAA